MSEEKRDKMPPIPANVEKLLNPLQLMAIRNVGNFGWELHFVRRNGIDIPVPVVKGADGKAIGVIDEDGRVDTNSDLLVRDK